MFRSEAVIDGEDGRAGRIADSAGEGIVRVERSEYPPATMKEENQRAAGGRGCRAVAAERQRAIGAGDLLVKDFGDRFGRAGQERDLAACVVNGCDHRRDESASLL